MDFIELAETRQSIRAYTSREVSGELLVKLLRAAQAAPSGGNRQPWHFTVIRDEALKKEMVEKSLHQEWALSAPVWIVVCADWSRSAERYGDRGRYLYSIQDTAAAIQNILLCAAENGLGTCWCGAFDEQAAAELLHVGDARRPVAIIPVGYPASVPPKRDRRPIEEIVTYL